MAQIESILTKIQGGSLLDSNEIDLLVDYECWVPIEKNLKKHLKRLSLENIEPVLKTAKAELSHKENSQATADICKILVTKLKLDYKTFVADILPQIIEIDDHNGEAVILDSIISSFSGNDSRIKATEKLCHIYEKKIFSETSLNQTYEKLLNLDPHNSKALRYFKVLFTQNYDWGKVAEILLKLIESATHEQSKFRYGQELAAILLYQLDRPDDALIALNEYCETSPLDTTTIKIDAFQRLGNWQACIELIRECLLSVDKDSDRAILHFKIAKMEEKIGELDEALNSYMAAIELKQDFYECYEHTIQILIEQRNWSDVEKLVKKLSTQMNHRESIEDIKHLTDRLEKR